MGVCFNVDIFYFYKDEGFSEWGADTSSRLRFDYKPDTEEGLNYRAIERIFEDRQL